MTWDSVVALGLFALAALASAIAFYRRWTAPARAYSLSFQQHPSTAAFGDANEPKSSADATTGIDGLVGLHARVEVKSGTTLSTCSFRLVERKWRVGLVPWRWETVKSRFSFVTNLWDADQEAEEKRNPYSHSPRPTARLNNDGGYTMQFPFPKSVFVGDLLWFRVIINVQTDCKGHLEFQGPTQDGRWGHSRRSVAFKRLGSDRGTLPISEA